MKSKTRKRPLAYIHAELKKAVYDVIHLTDMKMINLNDGGSKKYVIGATLMIKNSDQIIDKCLNELLTHYRIDFLKQKRTQNEQR